MSTVDGPRENRAAVLAQPGWDEWLLDLLLDSSPSMAASTPRTPAHEPTKAGAHGPGTPIHESAQAAAGAHAAQDLSSRSGSAPAGSPAGAHGRGAGDLSGSAGAAAGAQQQGSVEGLGDRSGSGAQAQDAEGLSSRSRSRSGGQRRRLVGPWGNPEAALVRALLCVLYRQALAEAPLGWTCLERAACHLRSLGARGAVNGWALLHALLADVVDDLLLRIAGDAAAAAAATDSWQLVGALSAEPMRSNAVGLLSILDEVTAGGLVVPPGEALAPAVEAVEWAEAGDNGEEIPDAAWQLLGVPAPGAALPLDAHMGPDAQRMYQGAWQLVCVLARALEGGPLGSPRAAHPGEGPAERGSGGTQSGARGALAAVIAGFGAASPDSPSSNASSPGERASSIVCFCNGQMLGTRCQGPPGGQSPETESKPRLCEPQATASASAWCAWRAACCCTSCAPRRRRPPRSARPSCGRRSRCCWTQPRPGPGWQCPALLPWGFEGACMAEALLQARPQRAML